MIGIIDYGTGNLRSVEKAFEFLGFDVLVSSDKEHISSCDKLVFPGVGAFGDCMNYLKAKSLDSLIIEWIKNDKPYLGICLGMQVLFEKSYEQGEHEGLAVIKGEVKKFSAQQVKVPQIGWNKVDFDNSSLIADNGYYYFVHSYYCRPKDESIIWARTNYGHDYCSAIKKSNIYAVQFHPEKSSNIGLKLLKEFASK